jgi:hypothetical protein
MGWSAEATAGELRHMAAEGMKVAVREDSSIMIHKNPFQYRLDDPDAGERMLSWFEEYEPTMAFIDPLRDFHTLDEKDDGEMNRMLRPLQQWAKAHNSALLIVHHARKRNEMTGKIYGPEDMRGTSALFGMADAILMTTPQGAVGVTVSATFKRGRAWERQFQLGMWGASNKETDNLLVDDTMYQTYRALRYGATSASAIATQIGSRRQVVTEVFRQLIQAGMAMREGRQVVAVDKDAVMLAAFKEWRKDHGKEEREDGEVPKVEAVPP